MIVIPEQKDSVTVPMDVLETDKLSWGAKGCYCVILALSKRHNGKRNWFLDDLIARVSIHSKDTYTKTRQSIQELIDHDFIQQTLDHGTTHKTL